MTQPKADFKSASQSHPTYMLNQPVKPTKTVFTQNSLVGPPSNQSDPSLEKDEDPKERRPVSVPKKKQSRKKTGNNSDSDEIDCSDHNTSIETRKLRRNSCN